ncbi:MAG TPA: RNA polymerase sigma-70 factor [Chitinophagaceae bacterium]|nr:RNA polymerase sigma-70 factor [Chitinophagaceae bacterium]HUM65251.1 RNA polymerase sigma-70 factor [Chitinophagaceae bacterium]
MPSKDNFDEVALVRELQKGSTEAFIQLYNRYHPALYTYIIKLIKLNDLTEDILQEVFLKIWTIRQRINPELSFQAYLYRISRNLTFKALKKISENENLRFRIMAELQSTVEDAGNKASWDQYESILRAAINALPPQRQKIFRLCRQEGKTYKEVSGLLNISPYTVKEHMVLATKAIREFFSRYGEIFFYIPPPLFAFTGII